ncbi:MAG: tRNA-dihydrouridine(20/20a) synthase DusA [Proteobacteria bacterium]|nr:tRNA-dihydrouridine(20/20a) synthase DusA [Pseudomonadota bacterium]
MENAVKAGENFEKQSVSIDRRISVAPMMDWTDRHCRYFLRGFAPHALLYTEMITAAAITRGDKARLLAFDPEEHPVALQLGGSNPRELAAAARAGEEAGYDEINLNCGCPSDRVASGSFGACLMLEPDLVADCVAAMRAAVKVPITVKMRVGVITAQRGGRSNSKAGRSTNTGVSTGAHGTDSPRGSTGPRGSDSPRTSLKDAVSMFDEADYESLHNFVAKTHSAGSQAAIIHARKAVLGGLSPKDNREIPPLRFDVVKRIKQAFPHLPVIVNGGIRDSAGALEALTWCEGVMLGREAYHRPFVLRELHHELHPDESDLLTSREEMLERMARYAQKDLANGGRLSSITRHMLGLYGGQPGAKDYRRFLSEGSRQAGAGPDVIRSAGRLAGG